MESASLNFCDDNQTKTLGVFWNPKGDKKIISGKMLMQKLWLTNINWDNEIPKLIADEWMVGRMPL